MSDAAAQSEFAAEQRSLLAKYQQERKQREKDTSVRRAMRYLCSITDVDLQEVINDAQQRECDPMSALCGSYLPPTPYGHIGLHMPDLVPAKAFSMFLIKPRKATERLEKQLEEAMCIYPADRYPIVGVIFLSTDKKMFVYCNSGVVDQTSVICLKFMKRTRFVYSLDAFCRALGLWKRDDPDDD